ncbi:MAG TPA: nitroreductase family protein [Candidatus Sulfotelmatobacter sp.]|nr:nitroreductase family protein [Candidatus Sulfotelmatobacter sp.]
MSETYAPDLTQRFGAPPAFDGHTLAGAVDDDAALHRILGRRTHRDYAPKPVPEALLGVLVSAALSASSKSDFQQVSIIRVVDPAKRAALAALIPAMPWIGTSPVFYVFCGDARRLERLCELRGHPQGNGRLEGFFNAAVDAALVMQTFILAAESVGLGVCPISVIRNHPDAVGEILGLPDKVFPVAGLCIGWPARAGFVSMRLPPAVTVHVDRYDDADMPGLVDAYDRSRDARHSIPPDKQRSPQKFGAAAFYGWSEDKARQAAEPEGGAFPVWLRKRGFTFD